MDFHQLLAKMQQLEQPAVESQPMQSEECGMNPTPPMGNMGKPDVPPPSMSVNLNAQGMDNIEQLLKLVTKVNPDMEKPEMPPMPMMKAEPSIMSIKPQLPPLKMLPDMDKEEPKEIELDKGDEEGDDKPKKDEWANEPDTATADMDAAVPDGNDLNKPKAMFKAAAGGDNPMKAEGTDLRSQIRAELLQRLAEAKGEK